jgi:hypothetical protein
VHTARTRTGHKLEQESFGQSHSRLTRATITSGFTHSTPKPVLPWPDPLPGDKHVLPRVFGRTPNSNPNMVPLLRMGRCMWRAIRRLWHLVSGRPEQYQFLQLLRRAAKAEKDSLGLKNAFDSRQWMLPSESRRVFWRSCFD